MADTRWRPLGLYNLKIYMDIDEVGPTELFEFSDITKDSSLLITPIQQTTSGGSLIDVGYKINFNAIIAKNAFEDYDSFFERIANNFVSSIELKIQAEIGIENVLINSSGLSNVTGLNINLNVIQQEAFNLLQISGGFNIPVTQLNQLFTNVNW